MNMKLFIVYSIMHLPSGHIYVGRKTGTQEQYDLYWGSSFDPLFNRKMIRENPDDYVKSVLCYAESADALGILEETHINYAKESLGSLCVNRHANGKWTVAGLPKTDAQLAVASQPKTPDVIEKIKASLAEYWTEEQRQRHSSQPSDDTRVLMSIAAKKRGNNGGRRHSEETKRRLSEAAKARFAKKGERERNASQLAEARKKRQR